MDEYDTENELVSYIDEQYNSSSKAKQNIDLVVGNCGKKTPDAKINDVEIALQSLRWMQIRC